MPATGFYLPLKFMIEGSDTDEKLLVNSYY